MKLTLPPPSINTWQSLFELERLLLFYRHRTPMHILELGSADGGSIWCWAHNCVPGAHILSVDWFHTELYPDNRHLYGHWAERNTCRIDWIEGDTRDDTTLARVKEFAPFDWLFIDAGHGLTEVSSDWERYGPLVQPGGVVAFHDITPKMRPKELEVRLLWDKLKQSHRHVEIIADVNDDKLGTGLLWV